MIFASQVHPHIHLQSRIGEFMQIQFEAVRLKLRGLVCVGLSESERYQTHTRVLSCVYIWASIIASQPVLASPTETHPGVQPPTPPSTTHPPRTSVCPSDYYLCCLPSATFAAAIWQRAKLMRLACLPSRLCSRFYRLRFLLFFRLTYIWTNS